MLKCQKYFDIKTNLVESHYVEMSKVFIDWFITLHNSKTISTFKEPTFFIIGLYLSAKKCKD